MNDSLVAVVKAAGRRLTDTQANLRPRALAVLAALGKAVGPPIHSALRHIGQWGGGGGGGGGGAVVDQGQVAHPNLPCRDAAQCDR
jgi:hypothetical protein